MYICISDIHIGHIRINAETMYTKLVNQLYPRLEHCTGLFIAGDFFDQLITMDSTGAQYATSIIHDLIQLASIHNFFIRILRGTFGHDRNQLRLFETITKYTPNVDLKYFDTIDVEVLSNGLKVLYLPDSLPFKSAESIMLHVRDILYTNKISKVDLVIGHGYFEHVLPPAARAHTKIIFTQDMFQDLVSGFVIFGHVHTHSAYKNVLYCGSFDRLAHAEEEAKGFLQLTNDQAWKCTFIKNSESTQFITVRISESINNFEHILDILPKLVSNKMNLNHGHLRLIVDSQDLKIALLSRTPYLFPQLFITIKVVDGSPDEPMLLDLDIFETIEVNNVPTPETLVNDILEYLHQYKPTSNLCTTIIEQKLCELK